jgi:hypothetical protein
MDQMTKHLMHLIDVAGLVLQAEANDPATAEEGLIAAIDALYEVHHELLLAGGEGDEA